MLLSLHYTVCFGQRLEQSWARECVLWFLLYCVVGRRCGEEMRVDRRSRSSVIITERRAAVLVGAYDDDEME